MAHRHLSPPSAVIEIFNAVSEESLLLDACSHKLMRLLTDRSSPGQPQLARCLGDVDGSQAWLRSRCTPQSKPPAHAQCVAHCRSSESLLRGPCSVPGIQCFSRVGNAATGSSRLKRILKTSCARTLRCWAFVSGWQLFQGFRWKPSPAHLLWNLRIWGIRRHCHLFTIMSFRFAHHCQHNCQHQRHC